MQERKLTKEDIDKVRDIDGFPIGEDEDIIALSNAPYYTACPNHFIEDFIKEFGRPYDEETDDYHCEPFASDVSEGKNDPIYLAHPYHTKVPYKAIMKYILHYTKPGDVVFDGFCGTGMTGVAAQMCNNLEPIIRYTWQKENPNIKWGNRYAILCDISPAATFISKNYTTPIDTINFQQEATRILEETNDECKWMWETDHVEGSRSYKCQINYIAWSDVLVCPNCSEEIIFGKVAATKDGKVKEEFSCPHCQIRLKKGQGERLKTNFLDERTQENTYIAKQVPLVINYTFNGKKYEKEPDENDMKNISKIENTDIPYWFPIDELPSGYNTLQPIRSHGYKFVHYFYTKRILYFISKLYSLILESKLKDTLLIWFTSQLLNISKLNRYRPSVSFPYNPLSGTLYISSLTCESSPYIAYLGKIKKFTKALNDIHARNTIISTNSTTNCKFIPSNSIDYIFTDPPFGANLNYSELSFIWESWLRIKTNNTCEAIINPAQNKALAEYQELMTKCFIEYYRVLKPNRWITVEFHNSKNAVWNSIQEALQRAGFIVADIRTLDKQLGTFKQTTSTSAVKQDLVISAYKPKDKFTNEFIIKSGSEEIAWDFIRQHLEQLPITVIKNNKIEIVTERQAFLLWDRMISYYIINGLSIPMDSSTFYKGLDEKFLKRDDMYFLPNQVNEYDDARIKAEIEPMQYSLIISNEKSAIGWLYSQLSKENGGPKTYAQIQPKFMQECTALDKREKMPELSVLLEENFLQDENGKWYIPDLTKTGDIAKLREKNLLKEFQDYLTTKGKLKVFRSEAIKAGFAKLWKDKDYKTIVDVAERLPEETIQEDSNLLMYYDISLSRV